jgi:glycosyl transferase family 25
MKAHVINLDRNHERLQALKSQLDALGIPFERCPAVDGKNFSDDDFQRLKTTRPKFREDWPRTKMACFLSHRAVWQKIAVSGDRHAAVFEDDLHVADDLKGFIEKDSWIPDGIDIIRLEPSTNRVLLSVTPVVSWQGRQLHKVQSTSWCAGGYIIGREAAKRLIDLPEKDQVGSADYTLFSYEDSIIAPKLNTLQVSPALCIQDKFYHRNTKNIVFQSEIIIDDEGGSLKARLKYAFKRSPITYLRRSFQGYQRIHFEPGILLR